MLAPKRAVLFVVILNGSFAARAANALSNCQAEVNCIMPVSAINLLQRNVGTVFAHMETVRQHITRNISGSSSFFDMLICIENYQTIK